MITPNTSREGIVTELARSPFSTAPAGAATPSVSEVAP